MQEIIKEIETLKLKAEKYDKLIELIKQEVVKIEAERKKNLEVVKCSMKTSNKPKPRKYKNRISIDERLNILMKIFRAESKPMYWSILLKRAGIRSGGSACKLKLMIENRKLGFFTYDSFRLVLNPIELKSSIVFKTISPELNYIFKEMLHNCMRTRKNILKYPNSANYLGLTKLKEWFDLCTEVIKNNEKLKKEFKEPSNKAWRYYDLDLIYR